MCTQDPKLLSRLLKYFFHTSNRRKLIQFVAHKYHLLAMNFSTIATQQTQIVSSSLEGEQASNTGVIYSNLVLTPQSGDIKSINRSKWIKNKRYSPKKPVKNRKLKPQSGIDFTNRLASFLPTLPGIDTNRIVSEIENISALFIALSETASLKQFAAILFLYLKTHCSGSSQTPPTFVLD